MCHDQTLFNSGQFFSNKGLGIFNLDESFARNAHLPRWVEIFCSSPDDIAFVWNSIEITVLVRRGNNDFEITLNSFHPVSTNQNCFEVPILIITAILESQKEVFPLPISIPATKIIFHGNVLDKALFTKIHLFNEPIHLLDKKMRLELFSRSVHWWNHELGYYFNLRILKILSMFWFTKSSAGLLMWM